MIVSAIALKFSKLHHGSIFELTPALFSVGDGGDGGDGGDVFGDVSLNFWRSHHSRMVSLVNLSKNFFHEYLITTFGFDAAGNEPSKIWQYRVNTLEEFGNSP